MSALPKSNKRLHPDKIEKIFSWCEKTFVEQTVKSFDQQMDSVLTEITIISNESASYQEKQIYSNLYATLKTNKEEMGNAFNKFLKKYFEEKIIPQQNYEFSADELSLVSDTQIDSKIASQNLESEMNKEMGEEVKNLSERMEFLLGKDKNPFTTDVLALALTSALEQILQDIAMQKQVVNIFSRKWPDSIKSTYEGMNSFLIDNDVLVDLGDSKNHIKRDRKKEMDYETAKSALFQQAFGKHMEDERERLRITEELKKKQIEQPEGIPRINLPPLPKISHSDVVGMFNNLLVKNGGKPVAHNSPEAQSLSFLHSQLQNGGSFNPTLMAESIVGGIPGMQMAPQTYDTIRDLTNQLYEYSKSYNNSPIATNVVANILNSGLQANSLQLTNILRSLSSVTDNQVDKTIIELVSVVFDTVFSLKNVPDHVKFLVGKLQIPVLKAAINDKSFFTQKDSSVRLFLNKITAKETAYNEASMNRFEEIVQEILDKEEVSAEIFTNASNEIDKLIELETKQEEQIIEKTSPVLKQSEKCEEHLAQLMSYTKTMTDKISYEPLKIFIDKIWAPHFSKKWSSSVPEDAESFVKGLKLEAKVQLNHGLIVFDMLYRSLMVKNPSPSDLEQLRVSIPKIRDGLNKICFDLRISNEDAQGLGFLLAEKHLFLIQREEEKKKIHQKNIQENENNIIATYKNKETVQEKAQKAEIEITATESNFNIIFVKGTWFSFAKENINMKLLWVSPKRTLFLFSHPKDKKVYSYDKAVIWEKYKNNEVSMLPADQIDTDVIIGNAVNDISQR